MDPLEYTIGTRVRLARSFDGCACGAEGTVVGFYRTDPLTYAVSFEGMSVRVPPEYLVAVDESE